MDALQLNRAVLAGYDWGGRAACVVAALWPERCTGLVSVNSYLIQDIAKAGLPLSPAIESGIWYQYYFQTERGRAGLTANRREIARILWTRNSPNWHFDEATLDQHASAFDNPDYVEVVIHSYRHRLGLAAGYPMYEELEQRLAAQPTITVPTITLDGDADGVVPATDGKSTTAKFSVLDVDISKCFDRINHDVLLKKLNTYPTLRRQIRAWLKAGFMDGKSLFPTDEGTPQGGVISPLLANIALHGLEELIMGLAPKFDMKRPDNTQMSVRDKLKSISLIRYADDFVVVHQNLEVIKLCKTEIEKWLSDIGLELKPSKTRLAHTLNKLKDEGEHPSFYLASKD